MNKLTLHHLGRRLAHGVKWMHEIGLMFETSMMSIEKQDVFGCIIHEKVIAGRWMIKDGCKPILRPKSDLTKPIRQANYNGGKEFVPMEKLRPTSWENVNNLEEENDLLILVSREIYLNWLMVEDLNLLLQWHFHIDEPDGTWIDVNELETNPYEI